MRDFFINIKVQTRIFNKINFFINSEIKLSRLLWARFFDQWTVLTLSISEKKVERASSHIPISKLFVFLHFKFICRMVILNFYDVYLFNFPLFNNVFYFYFASEIFSDIFWKYLSTNNISWWLRVNLNAFLSWFSKMFLLQKINFFHKNSILKVKLFLVSCWIRK